MNGDLSTDPAVPDAPKYARPKILLVDVSEEAATALAGAGYHARVGTFGTPYRVSKQEGYQPVVARATLPGYSEQEVIVINLRPQDPADGPPETPDIVKGKAEVWAPLDTGIIDPRPKVMWQLHDDFDRIYNHGGVFIVFAAARTSARYVLGRSRASGLEIQSNLPADNWSFLSMLSEEFLVAESDRGREILASTESTGAGSFLQPHLADAEFLTVFGREWRLPDERWLTLATNKFGQPVAAVIGPEPGTGQGWIFLLPQVKSEAGLLLEMLGSLLPSLAPSLFPHVEGARWVHRSAYELPDVVKLQSQIEVVNRRAREEVASLEAEIDGIRRVDGFLHALLTETGDPLVAAVKKSLETIGFQDVRDVDAEGGSSGLRREDLQVADRSPLLLIEVKGITSLPREASSLQVTKYVAPRMKELSRLDVQGLSIINHQRNLPALDRQNRSPFQPDVLTNAEEQGFGLLTTWDLFRLVRNFKSLHWTHEQVADLFYRVGRIEPTPSHYRPAGEVSNVWPKASALGVQLRGDTSLKVGDVMAIELAVDFREQEVQSLQVDSTSVTESSRGARVGIKMSVLDEIHEGAQVFVVTGDAA